jgi:pre-mRNA-processing factor SLU7
VPKSKYEEDVYVNNHKSVWGSWYDRVHRAWGYACCHQTFMNSYCTGEAGKAAAATAVVDAAKRALSATAPSSSASVGSQKPATTAAVDLYGEVLNPELDPEKLKKALKEAKKRSRHAEDTDERKRKYNSLSAGTYEVSAEDMEAYKMSKARADDPMAKFVDEDD